MRKNSTPQGDSQLRTSIRKPIVQTVSTRNSAASDRNEWRRLNDGRGSYVHRQDESRLTYHIPPGVVLNPISQVLSDVTIASLGNPKFGPAFHEFEFAASPAGAFPSDSGLPEDYAKSSLDFALSRSLAVVVAVTTADGTEPDVVLCPTQTTVRCSAAQVDDWVGYLGRRVQPRQQFAVVRFAAEGVLA